MKLSFLLPLLLLVNLLKAEVDFIKQPAWADVLKKAKAENKYIFLDAYTDWCTWCKVMDKNTFPEKAVNDYLEKNFVCVKMEMETDFGVTLAMKYRVSGFPTFLVFSPDGKYIDRTMGYQKPEEILKSLQTITAVKPADYPSGISASIEMEYPDFYKKGYTTKKERRSKPDSLAIATFLNARANPLDEMGWSVIAHFADVPDKYHDMVVEKSAELKKLYGKNEVEDVLNRIVYKRFTHVAITGDEKALTDEIFPMADKVLGGDQSELKANLKMNFYKQQHDYVKTLAALKEVIAVPRGGKTDNHASTVNAICWDVYERSDDPAALQTAADMMKKVVEAEPEYYYLDTYAALLYKTKNYAQAKEWAKKAIEVGKKSNEKVEETEKLLDKINAALP